MRDADGPASGPDNADPVDDAPDDGARHDDDQTPPDLSESLRQVGAAGRASLGALGDTGKALRSLLAADVSLARSAFGRTLAFTGVAIVFGASTWLLLMTTLVVFLSRQLGWPWWLALLSCALLSLVVTAIAIRRGMRYFDHTRMQATRRQLARLGIGEADESAATPASSEASAADTSPTTGEQLPSDDQIRENTTPP